jgi:hypothetical protein
VSGDVNGWIANYNNDFSPISPLNFDEILGKSNEFFRKYFSFIF